LLSNNKKAQEINFHAKDQRMFSIVAICPAAEVGGLNAERRRGA